MFYLLFRTILVYLLLIAVIRLMGKRQVGQMEPSEFVVTMLIANLGSIPMEEASIPLLNGVLPIITVLVAELILSWLTMDSILIRKLLCGKPVILMENGRLLQENLKATRITLDELTGQLRLKNVLDLNTVQYAILETNGSLSVFLYPEEQPASAREAGVAVGKQLLPITIVEDGKLLEENLKIAEKNEQWLENTLSTYGGTLKNTLLLTVDRDNKVVWIEKRKKR